LIGPGSCQIQDAWAEAALVVNVSPGFDIELHYSCVWSRLPSRSGESLDLVDRSCVVPIYKPDLCSEMHPGQIEVDSTGDKIVVFHFNPVFVAAALIQ
jgi:hypothetical protein